MPDTTKTQIDQPVSTHPNGTTTVDCMICDAPTSLLSVRVVDLKIGTRPITVDDTRMTYDRASGTVAWVTEPYTRYIPKFKRGLVCLGCVASLTPARGRVVWDRARQPVTAMKRRA